MLRFDSCGLHKAVLVILLLFSACASLAATPVLRLLHFQGRLCDNVGKPLPDNVYNVVFDFYNDPAAGAHCWGPESHNVTQVGGVFEAQLGSVTAFAPDLFATYPELWLEITVEGHIMPERIQLKPSPWAIYAGDSDRVDGRHASDFAVYPLADDCVRANNIVDGQVNTSDLAGLAVITSKINNGAVTTLKLADDAVTAAKLADNIDATGIGFDADKVDGFHASQTPTPNYILPLDANGKLPAGVIEGPFPPDDDWTISGNDIYRMMGNVGIGTASPGAMLDVAGDTILGDSASDAVTVCATATFSAGANFGDDVVVAGNTMLGSSGYGLVDVRCRAEFEAMATFQGDVKVEGDLDTDGSTALGDDSTTDTVTVKADMNLDGADANLRVGGSSVVQGAAVFGSWVEVVSNATVWGDLTVAGLLLASDVEAMGDLAVAGTSGFTGAATFADLATFAGPAAFAGAATFTGAATFDSGVILGGDETNQVEVRGTLVQNGNVRAMPATLYNTQIFSVHSATWNWALYTTGTPGDFRIYNNGPRDIRYVSVETDSAGAEGSRSGTIYGAGDLVDYMSIRWHGQVMDDNEVVKIYLWEEWSPRNMGEITIGRAHDDLVVRFTTSCD